MTDNPYQPPEAAVEVERTPPQIPDEVHKKIRHAWIAAIISGVLTLAITVISVFGTQVLDYDASAFFDVALIFGLAFGIYKRSRICALLMLLYFIAAKVYLWTVAGTVSGLPLALVFIYFYFQGVVGTFQYHKQTREPQPA